MSRNHDALHVLGARIVRLAPAFLFGVLGPRPAAGLDRGAREGQLAGGAAQLVPAPVQPGGNRGGHPAEPYLVRALHRRLQPRRHRALVGTAGGEASGTGGGHLPPGLAAAADSRRPIWRSRASRCSRPGGCRTTCRPTGTITPCPWRYSCSASWRRRASAPGRASSGCAGPRWR